MQEIDLKNDFDHEMLSFKGYNFLVEKNDIKSRCGIYIKNNLKLVRKIEMEGNGAGIMVVDLHLTRLCT